MIAPPRPLARPQPWSPPSAGRKPRAGEITQSRKARHWFPLNAACRHPPQSGTPPGDHGLGCKQHARSRCGRGISRQAQQTADDQELECKNAQIRQGAPASRRHRQRQCRGLQPRRPCAGALLLGLCVRLVHPFAGARHACCLSRQAPAVGGPGPRRSLAAIGPCAAGQRAALRYFPASLGRELLWASSCEISSFRAFCSWPRRAICSWRLPTSRLS
jgi:hypothetical protein